uniref:K Homology domain-containing protein n=1 Tax=Romanomermis culicivorax TaxID=13658 RepID=A0A915HNM3_ROMCU
MNMEPEIKVLIHQSQAGAIIGRGGTRIKELRETTGTAIKVFGECCPQSSDRVVVVGGEESKIINAICEIMNIVAEVPIKGNMRNYDATNYEPGFVEEYGGYHPVGGTFMKGGGGRFASMRGMGRGPPPPIGSRGFGGMGVNGGMSRGVGPIGGGNTFEEFMAARGIQPSGRFGGRVSIMDFEDETAELAMQQVTIPKDLAGSIIGKGGDRITRIREESGAKIVVKEPEDMFFPASARALLGVVLSTKLIRWNGFIFLFIEIVSVTRSMKRSADQSNGDGPKRFRNMMPPDDSRIEVRILIPTRVAGRIIGKGGENVKRLRTDFKASVTIPDSTAPERIVYVSGELDNIGEVVKDVVNKMEESRLKDAPDEKNVEVKVLVHKGQAGAIIGKGGTKIKEIRDQTKTNIKVFPDTCPGATDRVCVIGGEIDAMIAAMKEVVKCYVETPIKGPAIQYDTNNYDGNNLQGYGGYPPDRNWRGPMPGMGPRPGMSPGRPGMGGPGGYGGPNMGMGAHPPAFGNVPYMGGGGPMGMGGGAQGGMGMGGGAPAGPQVMGAPMGMNYGAAGAVGGGGQDQTTQVTIPKEMAGTIIGKGGERLKSIKEQSGAYVVVEPLEQGANDRIISITGTQQSIQMAQYLLQQAVRTSQFGRQYQ